MQTSIIWANNTNKIAVMTCSMILFQKKTCLQPSMQISNLVYHSDYQSSSQQ